MTLDDLREALEQAGLGRLNAHLDRLTLPGIRIEAIPTDEDEIAVGASKLGGRPDLPNAVEWPNRDGRPLAFLAQFNLAEIRPFDVNEELPASGMLYFFYDFGTHPWGLYPGDRDGWRVTFCDSEMGSLLRRPWPETLAEHFRLRASQPRFSTMLTMTTDPDWSALIPMTHDEKGALYKTLESLLYAEAGRPLTHDEMFDFLGSQHGLLGWPHEDLKVGSPWHCELVANQRRSIEWQTQAAAQDGDQQATHDMVQAYKKWRLLFQLGNISGMEWPWDDEQHPFWTLDPWCRGGFLYFWIEKDRLSRSDFSNVWLCGASQL